MSDELRLLFLTGPLACTVHTDADLVASGLTIQRVLVSAGIEGWRWQIIWPRAINRALHATDGKEFRWAQADLFGRMIAAACEGRAVRFMGRRWEFPANAEQPELEAIMREIEDEISRSGRNVVVLDDDSEADLVIGVRGYEK